MKTILFAPETINIAETTRMVEIAKLVRHEYNCVFAGYSPFPAIAGIHEKGC